MSTSDGIQSAALGSLTSLVARALLALTVAALAACGGGGDGASAVNAGALSAGPLVPAALASADPTFIPSAVDLVNTTLPGDQTARAIVAVAGGGYTVAWLSKGEPGNTTGTYRLFIQRYDATGAKVGGETLVPFDFAIQPNPVISVLGDGGVIVAYAVKEVDSSRPWVLHSGIYIRRFDSSGVPVGGVTEVAAMDYNLVGAEFTYYLEAPSIVTWPDGSYMVTWMFVQDEGVYGKVRTSVRQRYDSQALATGERISIELDGFGFDVQFTAIDDGGYLMAYTRYIQPLQWVEFTPFDSPGRVTPIPSTGQYPAGSSILPLSDDGYVLWSTGDTGPYSQILDSTGAVLGTPTLPRGDAYALNDGGFVVFWTDTATPGQPALAAQRFDGTGLPLGDESRLDTKGATPLITTLPDGGVALAWTVATAERGADVYTQLLQQPQATRQAQVKACKAAAQGLKGAEHRQFMRGCLKSA